MKHQFFFPNDTNDLSEAILPFKTETKIILLEQVENSNLSMKQKDCCFQLNQAAGRDFCITSIGLSRWTLHITSILMKLRKTSSLKYFCLVEYLLYSPKTNEP